VLKFESYTFKNILPHKKYGETIMSRHSSLKSSGKIKVKRNVLKRYERIDILKKTGKLKMAIAHSAFLKLNRKPNY